MPRVDFAAQAHRLKFLHANGGRAYFGEAMLDALEGPKIYLLSKLLADIDRDPEALLDEWYGRFAGKAAAAPLRELYDRVTAYWRSPKMKATPYWSQRGYVYLDPTAARQKEHLAGLEPGFTGGLLALADRVRAAAVTPGERRRADVLVRHFELLDAAAAFLGYAYCDPRTQAPADAAAAASMLEELAARAPEVLKRFACAKAYFRQPDFDDPDLYADAYLPAGMNRFLAVQFASAGRYVADGRVAAAFGRIARTETLPASVRTLAASVAAASRGEAPDVFAGGFTSALRAPDVRTSLPYAVSDEIRFDGARTLLLRPGDPDGGVPNPYDTALKNIAAFFVDRAVEPGFYIADVSLYSRAKGVRTADTVLWRQADGHALDWSAFARTDLPPGTWRSFRTVCFVDDNSDGVRLGVRLGGFRPGETVFVGGVRLVKAAAPDASARKGRVPASRLQRRGAVPETVDGTRALVYRPSRQKPTLFAQAFAPKKGSVRLRAGESFRATVRCRSLDPARPARVTARLSVWRNGSYEAIGNLFRSREPAAGVFTDIVGDIPAASIDDGAAGTRRLLINVFADASSGPVAVERIDWRIVSSR